MQPNSVFKSIPFVSRKYSVVHFDFQDSPFYLHLMSCQNVSFRKFIIQQELAGIMYSNGVTVKRFVFSFDLLELSLSRWMRAILWK
jgi:hypothetical protein